MSIEVRTEETMPAAVAPIDVMATPTREAIRPWRRRPYQISALLLGALVVAALAANNVLARQYSPEGAVRQYLSALQTGDTSTGWKLMRVARTSGAVLNLTDHGAFNAALATARPTIRSFAVTDSHSVDASTAAVTVSYETAGGSKEATFTLKRSSQNNLLVYPGWQVVVTPVVLRVSQQAGSGGIQIDGKAVAVGDKASIAVLPLAHTIRFPGNSVVQSQTIALDAFSAGSQAVVYQPSLTPTGVEKATAAIKAAFANCVRQTGLRPDGCPQVAQSSFITSGQWQLIGEPTQGVTFSVDSNANLVASGHFQMVFNYQEKGMDGTAHKPSGGGYQTTLNLASEDVSVASVKAATGLPALARPAAATDEAVEAIVTKALTACAAVTSGNPGSCPQQFFFPTASDFHWTLVTDPLANARVSYDSSSGLFTVKGAFQMKVNYKILGYPYSNYSNNTTYLAYLFWDGQQLVPVTIDGE
jgi:hypothetical protein